MKTFEDWSSEGYRIRKGEKAAARNEFGEPLFSDEQVWKVDQGKVDEAEVRRMEWSEREARGMGLSSDLLDEAFDPFSGPTDAELDLWPEGDEDGFPTLEDLDRG